MPLNIKQKKAIRKLLHFRSPRLTRTLEKLHPADIADLFQELNDREIPELIHALAQTGMAGQTLDELPEGILKNVLELIDDNLLVLIVNRLEPDSAVDFLQLLDEERQQRIVQQLPAPVRKRFQKLLSYEEDTAGALMTPDVFALPVDSTAQDAIDRIREAGDKLEAIFYLYVVDHERKLVGVVSLRQLILASPDTQLQDLMSLHPVSANVHDDQEHVSALVAKYDFLSIPVVDDQGGLVGVITVDDVIDVLEEEATEDFYHMAGLNDQERVFTPVMESVKMRIGWVLLNLVTASVAAAVVGVFEHKIAEAAVLATFMPLVAGMGGNSGSQTLAILVRGIALGELAFSKVWQTVLKKAAIGLILGLIAGGIAAILAYILHSNPWIGLVLFLAMAINMAFGALIGAIVPILLRALKKDPALGSGILVTALTDSVGYLVLFGISWMMWGRIVVH